MIELTPRQSEVYEAIKVHIERLASHQHCRAC
jgi:hypothetical protein